MQVEVTNLLNLKSISFNLFLYVNGIFHYIEFTKPAIILDESLVLILDITNDFIYKIIHTVM